MENFGINCKKDTFCKVTFGFLRCDYTASMTDFSCLKCFLQGHFVLILLLSTKFLNPHASVHTMFKQTIENQAFGLIA